MEPRSLEEWGSAIIFDPVVRTNFTQGCPDKTPILGSGLTGLTWGSLREAGSTLPITSLDIVQKDRYLNCFFLQWLQQGESSKPEGGEFKQVLG